jgi:hypothetical protein
MKYEEFGNDLEGTGRVVKEAVCCSLSDGLKKATRNKIAEVSSEIRNERLPNMGLYCYHHANLLGNLIIEIMYLR